MWDPDAPRFIDDETAERIVELRARIAALDAIDHDLTRTQLEALTARREARELRELVDRLTNTNPYHYHR